MSMSTEAHGVGAHLLKDGGKLLVTALFSYLLGKVVAKGIVHDLHDGLNRVVEDYVI